MQFGAGRETGCGCRPLRGRAGCSAAAAAARSAEAVAADAVVAVAALVADAGSAGRGIVASTLSRASAPEASLIG